MRARAAARPEPWGPAATLLPALVAGMLVHAGALRGFFAQDDITFLSRAAGLESGGGILRWLSTTAAFRLEHAVFGLEPAGYLAVNLALHLACVAGTWALGRRLLGDARAAGAAALLVAVSSVAFTPLHWATGIVELLTAALLVAASLLHLEADARGPAWRWAAALVAAGAMLSKETAVAWALLVALREACRRGPARERLGAVAPAVAVTAAFALVLALRLHSALDPRMAYAHTLAPAFLLRNLATYAAWAVAVHQPIRDAVATADPGAWRAALVVALAWLLAAWRLPRGPRAAFLAGSAWWLAFLLPVLPLAHHTYLYYLYVPSVGGALALAAVGSALARPGPAARLRRWLLGAALLALVVVEARNAGARATATRDHLPVDRQVRDATLLRHAIGDLRRARLPAGTRVGFVNPVPGRAVDLVGDRAPYAAGAAERRSYVPLEAALRGGETLRLFLPQLACAGFAPTIPAGWDDVECFLYEQRGWLRRWGHGRAALLEQARAQRAAGRDAEADESLRRAESATR
jgi:hypothetical protein